MGSSAGSDHLTMSFFVVAAIALPLVATGVSRLLAPRRRHKDTVRGPEGRASASAASVSRVHARQWLTGLLAVVFSVQVVLLYPWAMTVGSAPLFVLVEMLVFGSIVGAGAVYAWREGARR